MKYWISSLKDQKSLENMMRLTGLAIAALLLLIACAPLPSPTTLPAASPTTPPVATPTTQPGPTETTIPPQPPNAAAANVETPAQAALPAWQTLALTNARTGEAFTLADFAGKTVYVEPMATWCTNCRAQQRIVVDVHGQLNPDDYVFLSLSVGENVSNADLAAYAEREGFPWLFAVASPDLLTELVNTFGRTLANPPSTPHFVIRPDGSTTALATGQHSAQALVTELTREREA